MLAQFILYVRDQQKARDFYQQVLEQKPQLDVPGMTEFRLGEEAVLGLMPEAGIKRLLGPAIGDPAAAGGVPRAELYLRVENPVACHERAVAAGARELSPPSGRNWGDLVGYCADPDGHVLAFAAPLPPAG